MALPPISKEQQTIIELLKEDNNVSVNAVAGSGKTTTALYIAKTFENWSILLLTYNARLKDETREKVRNLSIINMEVHSYHAFVQKYYYRGSRMPTDIEIIRLLQTNNHPLQQFNYDLIIIDEVQDMTNIYYEFVKKILRDNLNKTSTKLCLVGDKRQCIYKEMKGADEKYLTHSAQWFPSTFEWKLASLSQSFRVPQKIARFVNECMIKEESIVSSKTGNSRIDYIITNQFRNYLSVYKKVIQYLNEGYRRDDIFILAYSVKRSEDKHTGAENRACLSLVNRLNEEKHYCWVANNDDDVIDTNKEKQMKNKIAVLTFHQSKGLERKVVIVYDFSEGYFTYYARNANKYQCPNLLYVATTRALEKLVLVHHYESDYLPFLKKNGIAQYCGIKQDMSLNIKAKACIEKRDISVKELIAYMNPEKENEYFQKIEKLIVKIKKDKRPYQLNNEVIEFDEQGKTLVYDVSPINGMAIPAYFEVNLMKKMGIWENILLRYRGVAEKYIGDILDLNETELNNEQILRVCALWNYITGLYNDKIEAIKKYNWLNREQFNEGAKRLSSLGISKNSKFEFIISHTIKIHTKEIIITGAIDCIDFDNRIVYEFKCGNDFNMDHYFQLAIYAYLTVQEFNETDFKYYLFNIKTDELHEIKYDNRVIKYIIYDRLRDKFINNNNLSSSLVIPPSKKKDKVLVFDLETTSRNPNEARIVELAYAIYTKTGKLVAEYSSLVAPTPDYYISNHQIHGITHKEATYNGKKLRDVIEKFVNALADVNVIVGHNINRYDMIVIYRECERLGEIGLVNQIKEIPTEDTIIIARKRCPNLPKYNLSHLYKYFFDCSFDGAHRALNDVKATAECYFGMKTIEYLKEINSEILFLIAQVKKLF